MIPTHDELGCEYYKTPIAEYKTWTSGGIDQLEPPDGARHVVLYRCSYCWNTWEEDK